MEKVSQFVNYEKIEISEFVVFSYVTLRPTRTLVETS